MFDEFYRVLIPGGLVLLAFQVGDAPRVLTNVFDQEVALTFVRRRPRQVEEYLVDSGFHIYAELVRPSVVRGSERLALVWSCRALKIEGSGRR